MTQHLSIVTISSRGQLAVPTEIRKKLNLKEGNKVLMDVDGPLLIAIKLESLSPDIIKGYFKNAADKAKNEDLETIVPILKRRTSRLKVAPKS